MKILISLSLIFLGSFGAIADTQPESNLSSQIQIPVEKYKLPNGLTVLLHEDRSIPSISYHTWFRVGSIHERPGITGIAHMFEHLMFKGTTKFPGDSFDRLLQANGATNNAFTSHDYTGYFENFPSDKLELIMDIESDRMVNLVLNESILGAEREVVKEERRLRVDNRPAGVMSEAMYRTVFRVHPYRWPVIGWMRDIASYKLDDFVTWYKTYYAPNNAVVVISGDISIPKTKAMIEKYYAKIPSQPIPENKFPQEPDQNGFRQQILKQPIQAPMMALGYKGVKAGEADGFALDLLSNILGQGTSSRLYKRLVYRNKMVTSVTSYNSTGLNPGIFQLRASLKPGVSTDKVQQALLGEVYRVRNQQVKPEELQKAKNQIMQAYVNSMKTIYGKAQILALNETLFGDYTVFFKDLDRYNQVTVEDIQRVAKKYLIPQKASYILLNPKTVSQNTNNQRGQ